jgi:KTSC domain
VQRVPVESTSVASVGYDPERRVLEIEFRSGSVYQYSQVPQRVHERLMSASSKGRYLVYAIRTRFRYRRIR